jgi:hypothetical protein
MTTADPRIMIPMLHDLLPITVAQRLLGVQPMTGTGGKSIFRQLFNKEYNKKYWPYQYVITQDSREAERWCWDRFKGQYWSNYGHQFVFKREKDAVHFALRWL